MDMNKEIDVLRYSRELDEDARVDIIKKDAIDITLAAMSREAPTFANKYSLDGYREKEEKTRKALLAYAAEQSGIKKLEDKRDLAIAFSNPTFVALKNAIVSGVISAVIVQSTPSQIAAMAQTEEVDLGDSYTWNIDTKGLPIAQRNSYMSNVAFEDSWSTQGITITPKVYSMGASIDFIRILSAGFDLGRELARVALGMLYAQYKLIVGLIFSTATLTGTPLYQATFDKAKYVQMISDLQMLNRGAVSAYGTLPAFNTLSTVATTNFGFQSQDELIRNGYIGRAYGIDNIVIDQATDLSAPFNTANAPSLRMIPNDRVVLLSAVSDKPVKLVRENFIHVIPKAQNETSLQRQSYAYFMSFDAAIATQAHYAIQSVTTA